MKDERNSLLFSEYYKSRERGERKKIRDSLCEKAGCPHSTFYTKMQGRGVFRKLEQESLDEICGINFNWNQTKI